MSVAVAHLSEILVVFLNHVVVSPHSLILALQISGSDEEFVCRMEEGCMMCGS